MESMEPRKKVEATFEKHILDDGCLARSDLMEMLKMFGLPKLDAEELLSVLDPKGRSRLPYKEFLDFIFAEQTEVSSTNSAQAKTQASPRTPLEILKKGIDDEISLSDLDGMEDEPPDLIDESSEEPKKQTLTSSQVLASDMGSTTDTEIKKVLHQNADTITPEVVSSTPDAPTSAQDGSGATSPAEDATLDLEDVSSSNQCSQCGARGEVFQNLLDFEWYCERCWIDYNGRHDDINGPPKLVTVFPGKVWKQSDLSRRWMQMPIPGWPPYASPTPPVKDAQPVACPSSGDPRDIPQNPGHSWVDVRVRVIPNLVGPHARECTRQDRPYLREVLAGRYQIDGVCGAGHFTRAFKATDLIEKKKVCVKRHNSLTVEILTDMMALGQRLEVVDPVSEFFPKLVDQFFDMSGYTVEAMLEGKNCLDLCRENPCFFKRMTNLRHVATGCLKGLSLLAQAGVVHADLKPDNIMWTEPSTPDGDPLVRIVDFGCARLDSKIENGRNWSLSEGGAGHLGKWAPEMALRLPITAKADVWGLAVSLLELYSCSAMWSNDDDTVEVVLAQAIGVLNARDGLPSELLRKSPLDITRLYSPAPAHFPCRRMDDGASLEEWRPAVWGLEQVLGNKSYWDEAKTNLANLVQKAMTLDPDKRPSASILLKHPFVVPSDPFVDLKVEEPAEPPPPPPDE